MTMASTEGLLLLSAAILVLTSGCLQAVSGVRVSSYNIRSGSGMDGVYNLSRTAEAIRHMKVDLIGLQEVDNNTDRHPHDDQAKILGGLTGLTHYVFGKFRDYENGGYGVAILSRFPIEASRIFYYVVQECAVPKHGDYCQGALAVLVNLGNQKIWFATTHLGIGFNGDVQAQEAVQLTKYLSSLPRADPSSGEDVVLVTGDFNSDPQSQAIGHMLKSPYIKFSDTWSLCGRGSGYTFNSAKPFERIDYAFLAARGWRNGTITSCQASVPDTQASDHRPLWVSVTLPLA